MHVDPGQLLTDGYLILPEVIPPPRLDRLRETFGRMVDRQREIWRGERKNGDPEGGVWESSAQTRLMFETLVEPDTAETAEFCLEPNTMGVSRRIMGARMASPTGMMLMCNPVSDHGPAPWHRDIHPIDQAPLCGLQMDLLQNAPGYLQWNIPLYDDEVLWVIPGSHRRSNTEAESRSLELDPRKQLPGGIPVQLKAGDGVVYTNTILHWGSNYSPKRRRTIHLGYRSFGGPILPYVSRFFAENDFRQHMSTEYQAIFADLERAYQREIGTMAALFRAMLDRDQSAFLNHLEDLHPGGEGRIVCCILLSKIIYKMRFKSHEDRPSYGGDFSHDQCLSSIFTPDEIETLWRRFSGLDAAIQSPVKQYVPGFQSGSKHYNFNDLPEHYGMKQFVSSWN